MSQAPKPKRRKRAESFIGIHFDLHAGPDCTEMGRHVTRDMVEHVIREVQPDYIQCDCKGHSGFSSYPTRVGYPAPGFVKDQLRIWREVTAEYGVALYMHYSGVIDGQAVARHPSWARIDEQGEPDPQVTSTFGPYVDELLIPQLKELVDEYDVDGVWVDGECWGTRHDYGEQALEAFRQQTGIQEVPRSPEEAGYLAFSEFCRQQFRRYLKHYVDELHAYAPGFQIASNWAYTSFMPEPVEIDVDYLSGDYSLQNSVNAGRFEARCLVHQGKPWDLMAWSFSGRRPEGCDSTKSAAQLKQEAAVVLSQGGGFQAYFKQKRDGSIYRWQIKLMHEVAGFCRARQGVCHHAQPVPQIALLYAGQAYYRKAHRLFAPWGGELAPLRGALNALLESQYAVEITMEHHLSGRMGKYPLIVVPEWEYLEPAFRDELASYVRDGGSLLLIGPRAAALFQEELQVRLVGEVDEEARQWLAHDGWLAGIKAPSQRVELLEGAAAFGRLYSENDDLGPWQPAASIAGYGRGKIAATYFDFGERYLYARTGVARAFLAALVRALFPDPLVEVKGSHGVDVAVNRIDGKLAVNLVNTAGPHANENVYVSDDIPPLGPLEVTIRSGTRPGKVTLEPAGQELPYAFRDGKIRLTLPRLEIHDIIVVE